MAIPVPMEPLLSRKLKTEKNEVENGLLTGDEKKLPWWGNLFPDPVAKIPHFYLFFLYCALPEEVAYSQGNTHNRKKY